MPRVIERYGRKADLPDPRDRIYNNENKVCAAAKLPVVHTLTTPPVYDQGQLGSCTGNGWARVVQYMAQEDGDDFGIPSRLFIYYNERVIENTVDSDSGAEVRTGAKVVSTLGVPPETDWAYDIAKFTDKPSAQAFTDAKKHEALTYKRIVNGPGAPMRTAIASGLPIVFGFAVPDYFEEGWDPATPLPLPTVDTPIIGGHCVVISGYDFSCKTFPVPAFLCDNSWGASWGVNGRFWIDYRWFDTNPGLATDLWVIQKES